MAHGFRIEALNGRTGKVSEVKRVARVSLRQDRHNLRDRPQKTPTKSDRSDAVKVTIL
jgi:hypothetical protein